MYAISHQSETQTYTLVLTFLQIYYNVWTPHDQSCVRSYAAYTEESKSYDTVMGVYSKLLMNDANASSLAVCNNSVNESTLSPLRLS